LRGGGQLVAEQVPKAVLQAKAKQVEPLQFANGGEHHKAEHGTGVVKACAKLQVGVGEKAEPVQGLVAVNGPVGRGAVRVAVGAKDGRNLFRVPEFINLGKLLVVASNGDKRNGKPRFKGETLRDARAHVPVAVQNIAQVVDDGLYVTGTVKESSDTRVWVGTVLKGGERLVNGGPALVVHGANGGNCPQDNQDCLFGSLFHAAKDS